MIDVIDSTIMEIADGAVRLIGGLCAECGEIGFPVPARCLRCNGTAIVSHRLGDRGVLWSWTVQRFPPPSPPYPRAPGDFQPFGVGYVELPGEVIIETPLTESDADALWIGMPMLLTGVDAVNESGDTVTTFAFAPEGAAMTSAAPEVRS